MQESLLAEWWQAVCQTPEVFRRTAFRRRSLENELQEALLRGSLRKTFSGFDLLMLGLGVTIASGWGFLTGTAAETYAGPSVILAYLFAGTAALLTATCYAELCLEYPVSGGAFSYIMVVFGELPAYLTLCGLLLEYGLGMAVVARGFSRYLARLCSAQPSLFVIEVGPDGGHTLDLMAAFIVLLVSVLLSLGVRESAVFISGLTCLKLVLIAFICIVGYTQGTVAQLYHPPLQPYQPKWLDTGDAAVNNTLGVIRGPMSPFCDPGYQADGVLLAAAMLFYTFTGYDAVCNAAEEARDVSNLPWALMGTAGCCTLLYMLLALSLVMMTTPNSILPDLPAGVAGFYPEDGQLSFITAFKYFAGLQWMQYVVAVALLLGIVTALSVGLFSVSRFVMAAARDWLLPPCLARVSRRTQTPLLAQMVFGVLIAVLAMFIEVDTATGMVSCGTLLALWLVCNAQLYRRYFPDVQLRFTRFGTVEMAPKQEIRGWALCRNLSPGRRKVLVWAHLLAINAACIGLGVWYAVTSDEIKDTSAAGEEMGHYGNQSVGNIVFAAAWAAATLSLHLLCPLEYEPDGWHIPRCLMPWLPSTAIAMVVFSVGALPNQDYWKSGAFFGAMLLFYLLFSLPMSYIKHSRVDYSNRDELNVVELVLVEGRWQPQPQGSGLPAYPSSVNPNMSSTYSSMGLGAGLSTREPSLAWMASAQGSAAHISPTGSNGSRLGRAGSGGRMAQPASSSGSGSGGGSGGNPQKSANGGGNVGPFSTSSGQSAGRGRPAALPPTKEEGEES